MTDGAPGRAVADGVAGVVLAAGAGTRLRPLTDLRPKALCPVGNRALVDLALDAVGAAGVPIAVNVHHGRDQLEPHLVARGGVHLSIEEPEALGTAGAIGRLRPWLDGRAALVVNADAWARPDLAAFLAGWDGERVRVLVAGDGPFGARSRIVASILPWPAASRLAPEPSGLWEVCWRPLVAAGRVDTAPYDGPFVDVGTPARYLAANRWAAALDGEPVDGHGPGRPVERSIVDPTSVVEAGAVVDGSVIGAGAVVAGTASRSVVWPDQVVREGERLDHAIRAGHRTTVLVR